MLLVGGKLADAARPRPLDTFETRACALFVGLAAVNVVAFLLECGLGPCPDDPTGYLWLTWAR